MIITVVSLLGTKPNHWVWYPQVTIEFIGMQISGS